MVVSTRRKIKDNKLFSFYLGYSPELSLKINKLYKRYPDLNNVKKKIVLRTIDELLRKIEKDELIPTNKTTRSSNSELSLQMRNLKTYDLVALRKSLGYTQEMVAEEAGINKWQVWTYENRGISSVTPATKKYFNWNISRGME